MTQADSETSTSVPSEPTAEAPESPADAFYFPTDTTPEDLFQAIGKLRKEARDEIDRLIGFLDKTDNYVSRELEDSIDDNPHDDNELDGPENAEDEESEPPEASLGSVGPNEYNDQERWASGNRRDLEDEHDGAEPDEDGEPSLGAFEGHDDQGVAWNCNTYSPDNELDGAESGIGDHDGLDEQVPFRDWQNVGMV
jgi:hypothetical protein